MKGLQSRAISSDVAVTDSADNMFEDTQPRQHPDRVPQIQNQGQQQSGRLIGPVLPGQQDNRQAEKRAHGSNLDFGFFSAAGEREEVKERNAQQQKDARLISTRLISQER